MTVFVPTMKTITSGPAEAAGATVEYLTTVEPTLTPLLSALTTEPSSRVAAEPPGVSFDDPIWTTPEESAETV